MLLLLRLLLALRFAQSLQLRERLLDGLRNRITRLHMRHLVGGVVQRAFHNEDVLTLSHRLGVLAQHDMIDSRQPVLFCKICAACSQPSTVVVVLTAQTLLKAANCTLGLAMERVLG
ncbi:hypothetical protein NY95_21800 [Xanthomonas citri pv. fuscans]|nr:hypothetical protein NB99_21825 [Xanthomonas citri pv. fuscans]KGU38039.1 hypothetical protein NY95_21800 [Xanthomonas citri pv. fuscans]KKY04245.1 hypothetical protein NY94_24000 [Xanthomonas phaseoli pv. phaseoli]